jgi:DNA recombination protein Rad52
MFTLDQKRALAADLDRKNVKQRSQSGRTLSYIEGWQAIAEANRIFGFDGWMRETLELKCVAERERAIGQRQEPGWGVTYIARVRVTVIADHTLIIREGSGTGHGIDRDLGQAHESALKEAETDAMKRALMTFGNPFGLALYDKEQAHVSDTNGNGKQPAASDYVTGAIETMKSLKTENGLRTWWASEKANRDKNKLDPESGPGLLLREAYMARAAELKSELKMAG